MAPSSRMSAPGTLRGDWDDSQIAGWTRVRCRGTTAADERGGEILCPHRSKGTSGVDEHGAAATAEKLRQQQPLHLLLCHPSSGLHCGVLYWLLPHPLCLQLLLPGHPEDCLRPPDTDPSGQLKASTAQPLLGPRQGSEDCGSAGGLFHHLLVPFVVCVVQVLCEGCELYKVLENDL
nr:uncharacterized protein LOC123999370 isoform X2 [Oncorhynchus gorbuscha]